MKSPRLLASLLCLWAACGSPAGELDAGMDAARREPDVGGPEADAGDGGGASEDDASPGELDTGADASRGNDAGPRCPGRPRLGLFVWSDDLAPRRDELLALAETHDVTEIYLHANLFFVGDLDEEVLAAWITAANERCIDVELLFGNRSWILPAGHREAITRTEWTVAYAASHPEARPSGIHFDLEPHQLGERAVVEDRPALIAHLATVLEAATPIAEAGGLPLSNDIGFFLDEYDVTRGGRTRPGHEWITDAVSRIVIMDYRDSAESMGFGGMISLAETEVAYATSVGTPIVLAVETIPLADEYVTFREEGLAVLRRELALVRAHFGADTTLVGFAIHDEDGLAALGP